MACFQSRIVFNTRGYCKQNINQKITKHLSPNGARKVFNITKKLLAEKIVSFKHQGDGVKSKKIRRKCFPFANVFFPSPWTEADSVIPWSLVIHIFNYTLRQCLTAQSIRKYQNN